MNLASPSGEAGPLRIGTRGSKLALAQAQLVAKRLQALGSEVQIVPIVTTGDTMPGALRGDGVFVKSIQEALLGAEVDLAVHSLKDVPTEPVEGLAIAAVLQREDPREALVGARLSDLGAGKRVGTSSSRRSSQLRALVPHVEVVPVRGNVPTRVDKARTGEVDAVLVAAAGLVRLGLIHEADDLIDPLVILPAPGQGAIAVEAREGSPEWDLLHQLDHQVTRIEVDAERAVLRSLGGGCLLPVGTYAICDGPSLRIDARVVAADGRSETQASASGDLERWEAIAADVAARLIDKGALELM